MNCIHGIKHIRQDVVVYGYCDNEMKDAIEACGGNVFQLPDVKLSLGRQFAKSFKQLLQEQSYSVVHGHLLNSAFIYLKEAKRHGVKNRIIHAHSAQLSDTTIKKIRNKVLAAGMSRWATNYIAVSEDAAKQSFGNNKNIQIIQNGIDTNLFKFNPEIRNEVRCELGIPKDILCIGHIARFSPIKNHAFLIDIFQCLRKRVNCVLVLVGDGDLQPVIQEKVSKAGLTKSVMFLGKRQDVHRLYQSFDVFMLPSVSEGFGLVAVEAQCAGLPCVVSEYVPKTIACSNNIRFIPLNSSEEWAKVSLELFKKDRIDGSQNVIDAKLDVSAMCAEISKAYENLH
ncbi:MAG: glycosyltransferase [Defluviitaleaceae bacterium]|nr:glycosyltransferase [Defluviitaleaceae bacterium]